MVDLVPMTEDQFHTYLGRAIPDYAQDLIQAGEVIPELAGKASERQFEILLPDGRDTPGQHLLAVYDPGRRQHVGYLWYGIREDSGRPFIYLYDFEIYEPYRRKGYGAQALEALEGRTKALELDEIRLRVFGHNHAARTLYEKLGYVATSITMAKQW